MWDNIDWEQEVKRIIFELNEAKTILKKALNAFHEIPNTKLNNNIENTYELANKISKFLKN